MIHAIILAAGFGTRLYPLTENQPKALIELGGKTLLDRLIHKLRPISIIREIAIVTSGRFFIDFCQWRKMFSFPKEIRIETNQAFTPEKREGVVRGLFRGMRSFQEASDGYLVLCADNYFDYPLGNFLLPCLGHGDSAFLGAAKVKSENASKYGVLELDPHGKVIGFEEKPERPRSNFVSAGVYYFPAYFQSLVYEYLEIECLNPKRIGDFLHWLISRKTVYAIEFDGAWFDLGDRESYEEARRHFEHAHA